MNPISTDNPVNPIPGTSFVDVPPVPTNDSTTAEWDVYLRAVAINNDIILRSAYATAQQNTAIAMEKAATAQKELVDAYKNPPVYPATKPTKEQLVWDALRALPEITGLTDLNITDLAKNRVEDYLKRFPNAVALG